MNHTKDNISLFAIQRLKNLNELAIVCLENPLCDGGMPWKQDEATQNILCFPELNLKFLLVQGWRLILPEMAADISLEKVWCDPT